ncbi:MAG TPA: ATP-binding protein [Sphingomicrobium sp.]|nr:ATP-binding protein [Sphingomicrobium sp.]
MDRARTVENSEEAGGTAPPAARTHFGLRGWRDRDHPYLMAIALVAAAFAVRLALDPVLLGRSPFLIFTAAIVIAAGRYGTRPGFLAMILSLVLAIAVFMAPARSEGLSADDLASLAVFIVTGGAMLSFAGHLKASREREQQLQAALQQVHTETAMGTMAATLAHELNQPLAAAANYVGASKRMAAVLTGDLQGTLVSGLEEAEGQIHRAGAIIRHARNLVSNASSTREQTSLRRMVGNALKPLQASGTCEDVGVLVDVEDSADALFVNAIQIEQVLVNVLRNACQAAGADKPGEIVVSGKVRDDFALVEVRDFGPGIGEDQLQSLFSARGRSTSGGLGLGLSISRTIVEAHGGKMWAENNPKGGASFFFTIPTDARP